MTSDHEAGWRRLRPLGMVVVTVALVTAIGFAVGWGEIWGVVRGLRIRYALFAISLILTTRYAESLQMTWIMRRAGLRIGPFQVLMAKSMGALYSLALPGDFAAGLVKWVGLAASTGKKSGSLQAIVYNRVALLFAEITFGLVALSLYPPWESVWGSVLVLIAALAIVITAFLIYHPRYSVELERGPLALVRRWLPAVVAVKIESVVDAASAFRDFSMTRHLGFFVGACALVAMRCSVLILWAHALGIEVPWLVLVWAKALLALLRQLPITIAGLGVREGLLVVLLAPWGVAPEQAVALGLVGLVGVLVFAGIGLLFQLLLALGVLSWNVGRSNPEDEAAPG